MLFMKLLLKILTNIKNIYFQSKFSTTYLPYTVHMTCFKGL
jgi:hypothetical protein